MAYRDLETITEKCTFMDYSDIFLKLKEKGMNFSQLKEELSLAENSIQQINEKKPLSFNDEQKIRKHLNIDGSFFKEEYYFDYPSTPEGISDKWKAIELFVKLRASNFSILVDRIPGGENKYKLIGNVNGKYYEKEDDFAYDTSAIIVFASYVKDYLD